jgi:signal transduction histidine kinase/CheY-like chemotaxis protein
MELRLRRRDGSPLFSLVAGSPIVHDGEYVGTMLNVSDVTGKRSIDAQVVQNQRLEAIGEFAGGIAHDFNNLLTSIRGYAELARTDLPEGDPVRSDIDQVIASAERASAITRKLLAFTRRQILMPAEVDPTQVIRDLLPICMPLLGDDVQMALEPADVHGWVRVDPTQLEQAILNLIVNARDAMPEGGTVTIAIHDIIPTDPARPDPDLTSGPFVRISVADTGVGMDDDVKARIFDPFYTTKGPAKGTGLGLSTVFGIVTQSGGQVQVESAPGAGATFHIDLPWVRPGAGPRQRPRPEQQDIVRVSGVVLVVEDDPAVAEFTRRSLESAGYTVLVAADGDQALRTSERWEEPIDLLVTDLAMPGVHGPELAAQIRAQRPGIGVLFMSGYDQAAVGRGSELTRTGSFLPKPFSVEDLLRAAAGVLESSRATPGR